MTFTYNLASADATIVLISKVRLEIGDTVSGSGVRRDNSNVTDEEISYWLTETSNEVMKAAIRACQMLSRDWASVANLTLGPRREEFARISEQWADRAKELSEQYGYAGSVAYSGSWARQDGFHDDELDEDYGEDAE